MKKAEYIPLSSIGGCTWMKKELDKGEYRLEIFLVYVVHCIE